MITWLFVLLIVAAAVAAGLWGYRAYVTGDAGIGLGNWFAPRPEPRLGISEQATLDSRRKLVLVRRDDVEHLIITGGPVDVVIETGISVVRPEPAVGETPAPAASPPVFTRKPRTFGQAVNE
jgi:flagellar protein FliO/FliZ